MESDRVGIVNPIFLWISPIENKVEESRKRASSSSSLSCTNYHNHRPGSPLLKAKTALQRRFNGGNGSELFIKQVNEALDACIWLKSAGFPQYVQKFEAGEFPLNLSKLQVEKDHSFLDGPAINSLIRRLNILNRCADLLEEILEKNDHNMDSEDDDDYCLRALSDQWHQSVEGRWSRSSILDNIENETDSPSLMITELNASPTKKTSATVKPHMFFPDNKTNDEPLPLVTVNGIENGSPQVESERLGNERDEESTLDLLGSFASGILDKFETTLAKLGKTDSLSRSLPNVFSASTGLDVDSVVIDNRFSVASDTSIISSNNEFLSDDECISPIHSRDVNKNGKMLSNWEHSNKDEFRHNSITTEDTISSNSTCMSRRNTLDSIEAGSFQEVFEKQTSVTSTQQHTNKAKWHSFHKQDSFRQAFKPLRTLIPIEEISVGQITVLRKLSLIKLTALLDLHNGKANVSRILKSKRTKHHSKKKGVFGGSLASNIINYGSALPPIIIQAMDHLRMEGMETVGLFRRTAAKSSIESLKQEIELNQDNVHFSNYTNYQVADAIKLFFRDLPEPLLTAKLSEALIVCYECIPEEVRLQALQAIVLLLPDENREALHCLLHFLNYISSHSKTHQMDAKNLGLCLSPSLFALSSPPKSPLSRRGSFRRSNAINNPTTLSVAGNKELNEHMMSSRCLTELIMRYKEIFTVATDMMHTCRFTLLEYGDPVPYQDIGMDGDGCGSYHSYIDDCIATVAKDQKRRFRGWVHCSSLKGIDIAYSKIGDGIPLKLWRASTEIPVTPKALLRRLWDERYMWDGAIVNARCIATIDSQTEVFQYVTSSIPPETHRDHCVLRAWRYDSSNNTYTIISTSVTHPNAALLGGVRCTELATRYWIEQTADGYSQLTFYYRIDLRGRSSDFYNQSFGHYLGSSLCNLRNSFKRLIELECIETPV